MKHLKAVNAITTQNKFIIKLRKLKGKPLQIGFVIEKYLPFINSYSYEAALVGSDESVIMYRLVRL